MQSSEIKNNNDDTEKYKNFIDRSTPGQKMLRGLKHDWKNFKRLLSPNREFSDFETFWKGPEIVPSHCDVLIIGGGAIGSSIAYWLREKVYRDEFKVVVVEKDPTVRHKFI